MVEALQVVIASWLCCLPHHRSARPFLIAFCGCSISRSFLFRGFAGPGTFCFLLALQVRRTDNLICWIFRRKAWLDGSRRDAAVPRLHFWLNTPREEVWCWIPTSFCLFESWSCTYKFSIINSLQWKLTCSLISTDDHRHIIFRCLDPGGEGPFSIGNWSVRKVPSFYWCKPCILLQIAFNILWFKSREPRGYLPKVNIEVYFLDTSVKGERLWRSHIFAATTRRFKVDGATGKLY